MNLQSFTIFLGYIDFLQKINKLLKLWNPERIIKNQRFSNLKRHILVKCFQGCRSWEPKFGEIMVKDKKDAGAEVLASVEAWR